jgi:hypothetical protein
MVRSGSLLTVCLLIFFPPSLLADGVHSSTHRADSFSTFVDFTDAESASEGGDSAFFVSGTFGSSEHHLNGLDDSENDHGEAWEWRKSHHRHHLDGDGAWNFVDQGFKDSDGDSGNGGSSSGENPSTPAVPEPSVLVLLSTALAAFLLKSLRSATD